MGHTRNLPPADRARAADPPHPQCNVCRLHGKVGALGMSVAMSVLLGDEGLERDTARLHRVEIAALVSTLGKFVSAIQIVGRMEQRAAMRAE